MEEDKEFKCQVTKNTQVDYVHIDV
jgi:hypothetical protein